MTSFNEMDPDQVEAAKIQADIIKMMGSNWGQVPPEKLVEYLRDMEDTTGRLKLAAFFLENQARQLYKMEGSLISLEGRIFHYEEERREQRKLFLATQLRVVTTWKDLWRAFRWLLRGKPS
jgi:hypothetical protein